MRVLSVVGARPQFIKEFAVARELRREHEEVLVHTGQHYDPELSDVFFAELGITEPDYDLGVGSGSHGRQTADCLVGVEEAIRAESPEVVLVYGDTNSTLAAALAAAKSDARLAHVEAGLRSYNRQMPEEINRILTDHAADLLFAPSELSVETLGNEGISGDRVHAVGDVMYDALLWARERARERSDALAEVGVEPGEFALATVHRPRNTDDRARLESVLDALAAAPQRIVFPVHPRTEDRMRDYGLWEEYDERMALTDPVGYFDFVRLLEAADRVATDSGGVQKEAFFLDTFCVTLREETEWVETVESGWNVLVGADPDRIEDAMTSGSPPGEKPSIYGDGDAAEDVVSILSSSVETGDSD